MEETQAPSISIHTTPCVQQTKIALLEEKLHVIHEDIEKLLKLTTGNGDFIGLKTQAELNKSAIKRIWWTIVIGSSILSSVITLIGSHVM